MKKYLVSEKALTQLIKDSFVLNTHYENGLENWSEYKSPKLGEIFDFIKYELENTYKEDKQ